MMSASAGSRLRGFLNNPVVAVVQASSILHRISGYAFGITRTASVASEQFHRLTVQG
ncbi:unnamed protein product, partial [Sphacelaria rigidula]